MIKPEAESFSDAGARPVIGSDRTPTFESKEERSDEKRAAVLIGLLEKQEKKLAAIVRVKGQEGLEEVIKTMTRGKETWAHWEPTIRWMAVGAQTRKRIFPDFLNALVDVAIQDPEEDAVNWTHSACHLFESYGPFSVSILDEPSYLPAAERLVDEGVRRIAKAREIIPIRLVEMEARLQQTELFSEEYINLYEEIENIRYRGNPGCISRIADGLIKFNLDQFNPRDLDHAFPFRPASLADGRMSAAVREDNESWNKHDYSRNHVWFMRAKKPREFLRHFIEAGDPLYCRHQKYPERLGGLLVAMEKDSELDKQALRSFIAKLVPHGVDEPEVDPELLIARTGEAEEAKTQRNGLYVDVEGTLIKNDELNDGLYQRMVKEMEGGRKVVIMSGGLSKTQTERLRSLGVAEQFLPVVSKNSLRGKVLESVIDDTRPEFQGFRAKEYRED